MIDVTVANFREQVLEADLPVLVDFFAPWCQPCKVMMPGMEELSRELSGKVRFVKVNIDVNADLRGQYGVLTVPTLVLMKDGEVVSKRPGSAPKSTVKTWLELLLK